MASADRPEHPETLAAQALHTIDGPTGAVVPPIHLATTFARHADYHRLSDLAQLLGSLSGARFVRLAALVAASCGVLV